MEIIQIKFNLLNIIKLPRSYNRTPGLDKQYIFFDVRETIY